MKSRRKSHIVLTLLAVFAAAVLFITYGTVLPEAPFASVQLKGPTCVDSDGEFTCVVDSASRRALIMNADGDLTGVVSCMTIDSPVNAITDACVKDGLVYLSGIRLKPDSEDILEERVVTYDKGGNIQGIVYSIGGEGDTPQIKTLSDTPEGVAVMYEQLLIENKESSFSNIVFDLIEKGQISRIASINGGTVAVFAAALSADGEDGYHYATLNSRGVLGNGSSDYDPKVHAGHVYTAIDIDENGILYACDDETGTLCAIAKGSSDVKTLVAGTGYNSVHSNKDVISLCSSEDDTVTLCDASGAVASRFSEVRPSIGFSARMLVVWASGLYLLVLVLVLGIRKLRWMVKNGKTEGIGPLFTAVAIVIAMAVAIGNFSFSSYQRMFELRANEINMCADHLNQVVFDLGTNMEKVSSRDALRGSDEELTEVVVNSFSAIGPALSLTMSARENGIGMYCALYGKDDKGVYYLYGSPSEYVMGSSAVDAESKGLREAFEGEPAQKSELRRGISLRDATQYRLVQIPTADGKSVAGVIEIGSKMRSFESSISGELAQLTLGLLVMVLVVYLAYSELRACGRCLFSYRQRQREDGDRAAAMLTRPFTLAITMLTSIDSVMTVLIARELLTRAGMDSSTPLLAVPAVMLGVGMVIGHGVYAFTGSRVGLRKLVTIGAAVMLACACFTGAAVASGIFWMYCAAKLVMSIPFGMLYSLGYSLPRLAVDDETRTLAAGGVKRTDTSAAALGTVLGGYAAHALGNVWVYVLVAIACLPVILMALNLLPRGMKPLEQLAQPDGGNGHVLDLVKTPAALGVALFIVLPSTLAAGYASFLFPLFSIDLDLSKADINNIYVLGQLVVYLLIDTIERIEGRRGRWKTSMQAIALLGVVFVLFALNTTIVWSMAVIAIIAVLCKASDGWKGLWLKTAGEAGVPTGRAASAMFATRSLALVAQPFILGALLGATDSVAVIVIGLICLVSAALFFLITRRTSLAK